MPERITITIKKEILEKIDKSIDKRTIRNRSHCIENLIVRALNKTDLDSVVILAGGEGTRLRPITYEIPKPLIPIHGRPILEHQLNMLKKYDLRKIILSVGYMNGKVKEYFGDGSRFGVNIKYIEEEKPLGTAGCLRRATEFINGTFLLLNVDTLMNPDIPAVYEFHKSQKKLATILLVTVKNPEIYGVVRMKGIDIMDFAGKPHKMTDSQLANAGLAIIEKDVISMIPKRRYSTDELFKKLSAEKQLAGYVYDGRIFDVGTNPGYEKAIKQWKDV